jgi:hypothetical protein
MSSQGPSSGPRSGPTGATGCYGATGTSQSPTGYKFTTYGGIRDGSDWISYKKQTLILKESKTKVFQDPWFAHGNDYRLQFMEGRFKNGVPTGCTGCPASAFGGNGPSFS